MHFFFYLKYNPVYSKKSQQILQTDGSGTGTFTSNITGLSANNTYYVRAYATNSVGTGYGAEVSFSTFPIPDSTEIYKAAAIGSWTVSAAAYPNDPPYNLELYAGNAGNYIGQGGQPFPNGGYIVTWTISKVDNKYYLYEYGFWHPAFNGLPRDNLTFPITYFKTYSDGGNGLVETQTYTKM